MSQKSERPSNPVVSRELNIAQMFEQDTGYVGFASGTGSNYGNHDIISWIYKGFYAPIDDVDTNEGDLGGPCYSNGTCNTGLVCENDICVDEDGSDGGDSSTDCQGDCCINLMLPSIVYTSDEQKFFMIATTGCQFETVDFIFTRVLFEGPSSGLSAPLVIAFNTMVFGVLQIDSDTVPGDYAVTVRTLSREITGYTVTVLKRSEEINRTVAKK